MAAATPGLKMAAVIRFALLPPIYSWNFQDNAATIFRHPCRITASRAWSAGDRRRVCAPRWQEALEAGRAPKVVLRATHQAALDYCSLSDLKAHAIDLA